MWTKEETLVIEKNRCAINRVYFKYGSMLVKEGLVDGQLREVRKELKVLFESSIKILEGKDNLEILNELKRQQFCMNQDQLYFARLIEQQYRLLCEIGYITVNSPQSNRPKTFCNKKEWKNHIQAQIKIYGGNDEKKEQLFQLLEQYYKLIYYKMYYNKFLENKEWCSKYSWLATLAVATVADFFLNFNPLMKAVVYFGAGSISEIMDVCIADMFVSEKLDNEQKQTIKMENVDEFIEKIQINDQCLDDAIGNIKSLIKIFQESIQQSVNNSSKYSYLKKCCSGALSSLFWNAPPAKGFDPVAMATEVAKTWNAAGMVNKGLSFLY
jgi:hypothetical protein